MLRVLDITLRGALRKAACRADGLKGMTTISTYAELAQLVSALVLQTRGSGFESLAPHHLWVGSSVAVER